MVEPITLSGAGLVLWASGLTYVPGMVFGMAYLGFALRGVL